MKEIPTKYKNIGKAFLKSLYAGFAIGIGGIVYLSVENKVIGSFLFSFGLLTIVIQGFNLYTGKIGFVKKWKELPGMICIILGNFIGTFLAAWMANAAHMNINSLDLVEKKLDKPILYIFILSLLCGVMMFLAIDTCKKLYGSRYRGRRSRQNQSRQARKGHLEAHRAEFLRRGSYYRFR